MNMTVVDGVELLNKAYEETLDERIRERWLVGGYEKQYSFDEFKDELITHTTADNKTDKEILEDVKDIINIANEKVVK